MYIYQPARDKFADLAVTNHARAHMFLYSALPHARPCALPPDAVRRPLRSPPEVERWVAPAAVTCARVEIQRAAGGAGVARLRAPQDVPSHTSGLRGVQPATAALDAAQLAGLWHAVHNVYPRCGKCWKTMDF